jgi:tetratricopeptide (TPR) repeat protein
MKIRVMSTSRILLFATFFLVLGAFANAEEAALDGLTVKLLGSPRENWDAMLSKNKMALDGNARKKLIDQAFNLANQKKVTEARLYAELADEIDYYLGDKKDYRGIGQHYLGRYYLENKNYETALTLADNILKKNSSSYYGHLLKGRVQLLTYINNEAILELKAAVEANPNSEDAHLLLGYAYTRGNNGANAKTEFEKVLKINPQNAYARDALTLLNGSSKPIASENKEAMAHFNKAEKFFNMGKHVEAIEQYKLAIREDPKFTKAYIYMGDSYLSLGQRDEAIRCYQKAIELDPKDKQAHRFLGDVYEKVFDETKDVKYIDLAISYYQNAVKADPSYQTANKDLERAKQKKLNLK